MPTTKPIILAALLAIAADKPKAPAPPPIDEQAIQALEKMGSYLRSQERYTVHTRTDTDYVLPSGQKVRLSSRGQIEVEKPNRLRADTTSERKERQFFYDGKTFTIYSPRIGYYATLAAPPTVRELADYLQDQYGLELPMVDLFRWGTPDADEKNITSAMFIGTTNVDGVDIDHYAFRQPGLDWQIWIQHGDCPLPVKLLLTTTDDPALPEHAITMTWDLGAKHDPQAFVFRPPANSKQISVREIAPAPRTARQP
jgi:hypothetical protein